MNRVVVGFLLLASLWPRPLRAEDPPPLSVADLAAYRAALEPGRESAPAGLVTFRDLWDHPERYQGESVAVAGRLARLFRQPGVGQFPPLAEAWVTSPRGEPFCLVFPAGPGATVPEPGSEVRFQGTFLRRVAYKGGDADRIAPLVVGPTSPTVVANGSSAGSGWNLPFGPHGEWDWLFGLVAAGGVALMLLRRHLGRPPATPGPLGPAPAFVDGSDPDLLAWHDEGESHGDA